MALLWLAEDRKVNLKDPVGKYLEEFATGDLGTVTVRDLLSRKPGALPAYERAAVKLVEQLSGAPFGDFLAETFFKPLGMDSTSFAPPATGLVKHYGITDGEKAVEKPLPPYDADPYSMLFTTPRDLGVFYTMLMNNGREMRQVYVSPKGMGEFTPRRKDGEPFPESAFGMDILGDATFGFDGNMGTYCSVKPAWKRMQIFCASFSGTNTALRAAWTNACAAVYSARVYGRNLRTQAKAEFKDGNFEAGLDCLDAAAELDGSWLDTYLAKSEAYRGVKDFEKATEYAEKAFLVNPTVPHRTFHCTSALCDSLKGWKGPDAVLDRFEEIIRDEKKYLNDHQDITSILSSYCLLAYRNFRYDRVRWGLEEHKRQGVKEGAYIYRSHELVKMLDDMAVFPKPESEIKFPQSLADLGIADTNTVHAKDFGWDPENASAYLQKAMDSGATTVVLDDMGAPWRITSVTNRSNQRILLKKGVKVYSDRATAEKNLKNVNMFCVYGAGKVIIEGEGDNAIGKYASYEERKQWNKNYGGTGISVTKSEDVVIRNLRIAECSMDAICLGGSEPYNTRIWLDNLVLDSNYRQAMSICGADEVYCRNVRFDNTRGAAPSAGIDLEPAIECYPDASIYLFDCSFSGNNGGGLVVYTSTYTPVTLHAKRCSFAPNGPACIEVFARCGIYMGANVKAPSNILIEDCDLVSYADKPALCIQSCSLFDVTLKNCRLRENGVRRNPDSKLKASPIAFSLNRDFGKDGIPGHMIGKVRFENVTVDGWGDAPLVMFEDELGMLDIIGVLQGEVVYNGVKTDISKFNYVAPDRKAAPLEMPDLKLLPPPLRKVGADEVYESNMSLSWNGAWFQTRPQYNILYWAEKGRKVMIDDLELVAEETGWHAFFPESQKKGEFKFKKMVGARPVYLSDVYGNNMAKFVLKDTRKGYTGYFAVPADAEAALRVTWGDLEIRNAVGEVVGSARKIDYGGRHVFALKSASGKPEIWSFTTPPAGSTRVLRFYVPLNGMWADDPADLPADVDASSWEKLVKANKAVADKWDDSLLADTIDWSFLGKDMETQVRRTADFRLGTARKGLAAAALRAELDKIENIKKNATNEANLRDANEELKNLPPLERRAALEKAILAESQNVRKLAAYLTVTYGDIPAEMRKAAGIELVDGLLEYRDVAGMKSLLK